MAKLAQGLDLQVSGFRIAPRDSSNPHVAAIGEDKYFFQRPTFEEFKPKILKEKIGLGGGFKIQEETLKSKAHHPENLFTDETNEDLLMDDSNIITRDEIIKELNLATGTNFGTEGKDGQLTKAAITKELVDNLTKELEKLRRQSDNINMRKTLHVKGHIEEETEEERNYKIKRELEDEKGASVIHAENERVQAMRHQTGQLGGLGAITMEEVVAMREQTQSRIKDLEIEYYKNRDTRFVSDTMRRKLQSYNENNEVDKEKLRRLREKEADYLETEAKANEIREKKKFLASPYNPKRSWVRRIPEMKSKDDEEVDEVKLLSRSKMVEEKKLSKASLKRLAYEAKYSKYKVNKKLKHEYDDEKDVKKDFDLYLKGKESAHVDAKKIDWDDLFAQKIKPSKYSTDYPVYKSDYDIRMLETVRQKLENLSKEDKLTFSILKWIFNALKKGNFQVNRRELVEQLDQNIDILQSLGFESTEDVSHSLNMVRTKSSGKLTWEEFLDFFGSRTDTFRSTGQTWWKTEEEGKEFFIPIDQPIQVKLDPEARKQQLSSTAFGRMTTKPDGKSVFEGYATDKNVEGKMKKLADSRVNKLVVEDIERELADLKRSRSKSGTRDKTMKTTASLNASPEKDVFSSGPQCVLQHSHIEIMKEVYNQTDLYNDQIVRRSDLIKALRENKSIQKFLDQDAIKIDRKVKLSVEDVLKELHKDQFLGNDDSEHDNNFDHKEFITWEEFVDFFENFKTSEMRMRANEDEQRNRKKFLSDRERKEYIKDQIEEEKDRRVEELPRFREDDIIDADEEYLDILFEIFDVCHRAKDNAHAVDALEFFMALKKDPKVIKINDTIAREPSGKSRIAMETYSEVFYRMEKEHENKHISWATALEYFTKRGRPLSESEVEIRKQEDRDSEDQYEQEIEDKKAEEERFFENMREEQKDLTSTGQDDHFNIENGRIDIEDMEVASNSRPDFHSTVNSRKKVSFQDTFNDRGSTVNVRPQTAKSKFDNTLSRESLSGKDYSDHRKSKFNKSQERKLTVPKPFKFDTRDKIRAKSIRERKIDEMIEEKKIEEERILGHQFRAKRPAREIITPMYQKIMDKNEQRRMEVKENSIKMLQSQERPFSFYERDKNKPAKETEYVNPEFLRPPFKANEVPTVCTVDLHKIMIDKQNREREIRIKKNAEKNFKKSHLPPRMEMHERMKAEKGPLATRSVDDLSRFGTFQPPRAKPVPDFERLQKNFQTSLDKKKTSKKLTQPEPFMFEAEYKQKVVIDEENDPEKANVKEDKKKDKNIPPYLKKWRASNPETAEQRKQRKEEAENAEKNRPLTKKELKQKEKEEKFRGSVKSIYQSIDNTKEKDKEKKRMLEQKIKDSKEQEAKTRKMIQEMVERGRSKDFLIERYEKSKVEKDQELQGLKAVKMVKDTMVRNGLDPNKHMSEDQKDKLADAEFLHKHKLDKLPHK